MLDILTHSAFIVTYISSALLYFSSFIIAVFKQPFGRGLWVTFYVPWIAWSMQGTFHLAFRWTEFPVSPSSDFSCTGIIIINNPKITFIWVHIQCEIRKTGTGTFSPCSLYSLLVIEGDTLHDEKKMPVFPLWKWREFMTTSVSLRVH